MIISFVLWSPELDGFDLEDALDDRNDLDVPKKPSTGEEEVSSRCSTSQANAIVPGMVCLIPAMAF